MGRDVIVACDFSSKEEVLSFLDKFQGDFIVLLEIIGGIVNVLIVKAQPMHIVFDAVHKFLAFCG